MSLNIALTRLLSWIAIVQFAFQVESLPSIRFGRHWKGFVGEPSKIEDTLNQETFEELWFNQKLDHFSSLNSDEESIWKQRYFVNEKFYLSNNYNRNASPIFLMINGEAKASSKWMHQGAWIHYAKTFDALCFLLEHRFYGQSQPTRYHIHSYYHYINLFH